MTLPLLLACPPDHAAVAKDAAPADSAGDSAPGDSGHDSGADSGDDSGDDSAPDTAPPGPDDDGDGWTVADGDCDDTRDNVYPGAPDGCDGLDQDCDGEAIPPGACGGRWDPVASASWVVTGTAGDAGLEARGTTGPTDASGRPGAALWLVEGTASAGAVLPGAGALAPRSTSDALAVWASRNGRDYISLLQDAGDLDGDGLHDLATGYIGASDSGRTGNLYVLLGREGGWPAGVYDVRDAADGWWTDEGDTTSYLDYIPGADLDADGYADLVLVSDEGDGVAAWRPYLGGAGGLPYEADVASVEVALTQAGGALSTFYYAHTTLPDLDGDGSDEIMANDATLVGERFTLLTVEGEQLLGEATELADVASYAYFIDDESPRSGTGFVTAGHHLAADIDGDGHPELSLSHSTMDADGEGSITCASLVLGGAIPEGDLSPREHARVCAPHDTSDTRHVYSYALTWLPDVDGDGLSELYLYWNNDQDSRDTRRCVLRASEVAAGGVYYDYDPQTLCFWGEDAQDPVFADLTGDGLPEWIFSDDGYDDPVYGEDAGRVLIVEGFELPLDDPSRW